MHKVDFDIGVVTYHLPVMTVCRQEGMVDPRAGAKVTTPLYCWTGGKTENLQKWESN